MEFLSKILVNLGIHPLEKVDQTPILTTLFLRLVQLGGEVWFKIGRWREVWGNVYRTTPSFLHLTLDPDLGVGSFLGFNWVFFCIIEFDYYTKTLTGT